jgi:hypothetical protein
MKASGMMEPRPVEAHLRILENIVGEITWVQGKDRGDALEDLARRAVEDIHLTLLARQVLACDKTRSKGDECVGYIKTCLNARGNRESVRKYQSCARNSLQSLVDYLEETGAISEPFKFR